MEWGAALAGGFLGTVVFTLVLYGAAQLSLTRLDLAVLLGTAAGRSDPEARAIGAVAHIALGLVLGLAHGAVLAAVETETWWAGLASGTVHGALSALVVLPLVLPAIHPLQRVRVGGDATLVESPGFACRHYGPATPLVLVVAHAVYGLSVGAALQAA